MFRLLSGAGGVTSLGVVKDGDETSVSDSGTSHWDASSCAGSLV